MDNTHIVFFNHVTSTGRVQLLSYTLGVNAKLIILLPILNLVRKTVGLGAIILLGICSWLSFCLFFFFSIYFLFLRA